MTPPVVSHQPSATRPERPDESLPLVLELNPVPSPDAAFARLSTRPGCLFLDSSLTSHSAGRYSFLTADPFDVTVLDVGTTSPLEAIRAGLRRFHTPHVAGLPPFQGGAAGLLGYELAHSFERLPATAEDPWSLPAVHLRWYDVVVAWDHRRDRAWLISHGWPELEGQRRRRRARQRLLQFTSWLREPQLARPAQTTGDENPPCHRVHPIAGMKGVFSNFDTDAYPQAVRRVIEHIQAGDVFQVNLSQQLMARAHGDPVDLYRRLRRHAPAPFAAYYDADDFQVLSASPERFLQVADGAVATCPIKGTRPHWRLPEADLYWGQELRTSTKDCAENVMIVDLMRNDLSRVCLDDSVVVEQLCQLEAYAYVQHLVSTVTGRLRPDCDHLDAVAAAFPGGSITGAPKIRAMEIITHLEGMRRGAYCGSLGYFSFGGPMDLSILIRTLTSAGGWWQIPVGGGIVADSNPHRELEETWTKARWALPVVAGLS